MADGTALMLRFALIAPLLFAGAPAIAAIDEAQAWFNQQATIELGESTDLLFEAEQKLRGDSHGGNEYEARINLDQEVAGGLKLGGGATVQRSGGRNEFRTHQQITYTRGILASRTRMEQRFQQGKDDMVWRLRQRLQLTRPVAQDWDAQAYVEGSFTLNAGNPGDDTGLTSLRTLLGARHRVTDSLRATFAYIRHQDMRDGAPDRVGHVAFIGLAWSI